MTVGELRRALEGVSDTREVGVRYDDEILKLATRAVTREVGNDIYFVENGRALSGYFIPEPLIKTGRMVFVIE